MKAKKVLKEDSSATLKMNFTVIVASVSPQLREFLLIVKRGECACMIQQPTKEEEEHAKQQAAGMGLFALPKEPKPTKEAKGDANKVPPPVKPPLKGDAKDKNPSTDKPDDENGSLASHSTMKEPTLRGRGRHKAQK